MAAAGSLSAYCVRWLQSNGENDAHQQGWGVHKAEVRMAVMGISFLSKNTPLVFPIAKHDSDDGKEKFERKTLAFPSLEGK